VINYLWAAVETKAMAKTKANNKADPHGMTNKRTSNGKGLAGSVLQFASFAVCHFKAHLLFQLSAMT
jgi:hypothetical protein